MKRSILHIPLGLALALAAACGRGGTADTDTGPAAQPQHAELQAPTVPAGSGTPLPVIDTQAPVPSTGGGPDASAAAPAGASTTPPPSPNAPSPQAPAQAAADARQILERVERTYAGIRSLEADFVQQLRVPLLGSDQQSRGRFYQRQPDRLLMRFSEPAGDVIVADGRHLWMYYPSVDRNQVLRASLAQAGGSIDFQREFIQDANQRYAAVLTGAETVDGRATHVLDLTPRTPSGYRSVRIWVDQQNSLVRRFEVVEQNDSMRRIELRNLRQNVNLDDALFRFTVPQGAQVFDQ
jgi:outer membrane lipoprotein carrier protein